MSTTSIYNDKRVFPSYVSGKTIISPPLDKVVGTDSFFTFLDESNDDMLDKSSKIEKKKELDKIDITKMFDMFREEIEDESGEEEVIKKKDRKDRIEEEKDECIRCGAKDLYNNEEMIVCRRCGCENSSIFDTQAEWRFYHNDDNKRTSDPNRCGLPTNPFLKNTSLSITMSGRGFEVYRKVNSWNGLSYQERQLMTMLNIIMNKAHSFNVPQSVIDRTIYLYQTYCLKYVKKGTPREALLCVAFMLSMREAGYIKSQDEFAELFNLKMKKLSKAISEFTEIMYKEDKEFALKMKPMNSKELIQYFSKKLNFTEKQVRSCLMALYGVEKLAICHDHNSKSVCVGIIFLISEHYGLPYSRKEISEVCDNTSEVTIGSIFLELTKFKKYLVPQ